MKFCFVILHYKAICETIKCIDSILRLNEIESNKIIVVDNGSQNGSYEELCQRYKDEKRVVFVPLESNMGFSAGNNAGCQYAIQNFNPQYLIVANNDIIFAQDEFLEKIDKLYQTANFVVAGPDIIHHVTKQHQSPISKGPRNLAELEAWIRRNQSVRNHTLYWYIRENLIKFLYQVYSKAGLKNLVHKLRKIDYEKSNVYSENVCLSGACLIIEKKFWEKREKIFSPETFLYLEEDILFYQCAKLGYKVVYTPEIYVIHGESVSTGMLQKSIINKMKFCANQNLNSAEIYKRLLLSNMEYGNKI